MVCCKKTHSTGSKSGYDPLSSFHEPFQITLSIIFCKVLTMTTRRVSGTVLRDILILKLLSSTLSMLCCASSVTSSEGAVHGGRVFFNISKNKMKY